VWIVIEAAWHARSLPARLLRMCLVPFSLVFGLLVAFRNTLYDHGLLRVRRVTVPVVSVGNLRVGGTGKTPFVIWLVERLKSRGFRVAVVSRGYGADPSPTLICSRADAERIPSGLVSRRIIVEDAQEAALDAADEALLVAMRTGVCVATGSDRYAACAIAEKACAPDVIVLDDGFQHRRLGRDVDVVLLGPDDRAARLLPAGPLRERASALGRADVVIESAGSSARFRMKRTPAGIVRTVRRDAAIDSVELLRGATVTAVSAVASNESFFSMLRSLGANLEQSYAFPDHHRYSVADWTRIAGGPEASRWVVTTEKDLVKLEGVARCDSRLRALRLELDVDGGEEMFALICARARLDARPRGQHDRRPRPSGVET
jgi:tetraacyldisaccharide 4'-kinase